MVQSGDKLLRVVLAGQALARFDFRECVRDYFAELLDLVKGADVFFSNLEAAIQSPLGGQQAKSGRYFVAGEPEALDSLKSLGLNLLALSNNHSYDMGPEGILATRMEARRRGFVCAGTGANTDDATAPGYLATPKGTMALVAMASGGLDPAAPAGPSTAGVNELAMEAHGTLRASDLKRNLAAIREAADRSDYVLAYHHSHYWASDWHDTPQWQRDFAHMCIDAGATIYCGHGAPLLHGVEFYQGKPIFYSLGNFIFQLLPDEVFGEDLVWESAVADIGFLNGQVSFLRFYPVYLNKPVSATDRAAQDSPSEREGDAESTSVHILDRVAQLLDKEPPKGTVCTETGLPRLARAGRGISILKRLARSSEQFGTTISIHDDGYAEVDI